jgi:hypothetical protein
VALLLILALLGCCLVRRRRQVRDPKHPREKVIGSYLALRIDGSKSSSEKDRRSNGSAGADLLGAYPTARTNSDGVTHHSDPEEQLYEPSPFFARGEDGGGGSGSTAGVGAAAAATAAAATGIHSRNPSYGNDSSTGDKTSSEQNRISNTNRNSNSTGYGIDWNPQTWGREPPSLASEPHTAAHSAVFGESGEVSSTGGATPAHPTNVIGGPLAQSAMPTQGSPQLSSGTFESSPAAAGVIRGASTRKPPVQQQQPPSTLNTINRRQSEVISGHEGGLQTTGLGPDALGRPTRFVLHEDAGAMVDDAEEQM